MSLADKRRDALVKSIGSGDRRKIGFLVILLIVVLVGFAALTFFGPKGKKEQAEEQVEKSKQERQDREVRNDEASVLDMDDSGHLKARVETAPPPSDLGEETPVELEKLVHVRDDSTLSRERIEVEPLDYLLHYVHNVPSIVRKSQGFQTIDPALLLDTPHRYRGVALEFKGELVGGRDEAHEGVDNVDTIHRGFLKLLPVDETAEAPPVYVSFTSVGAPRDRSMPGIDGRLLGAGEVVRVFGYFLKVYRTMPPGEDRLVDTPHIVTQRFLESFRVLEQMKLNPLWFQVRDSSNLDEPPFWLALNYLRNLTPETYRSTRDASLRIVPIPMPDSPFPDGPVPETDITDFAMRGKILHDYHERFRGKLVRVSGTLMHVDAVPPGENLGGIDRYWAGFVAQYNYIVPFAAPFPMERYGVDPRKPVRENLVHVEGYLYKRWIWDTKANVTLRGPYLLVTDIYPQKQGGDPLLYVQYGLAVIAVLFIGALVWMLVRDRRSSEAHEQRRRSRRVRSRAGEAPPASGDPVESEPGESESADEEATEE